MRVETKDYPVFCICFPNGEIDGKLVYEIDPQFGFDTTPYKLTKLKYDLNSGDPFYDDFKVKKVMFTEYISKFVERFCED